MGSDSDLSHVGARRGRTWRRVASGLAPKLIAAAIVLGYAGFASGWLEGRDPLAWGGDPQAPADLQDAVSQVFAGRGCVGPTAADATIRSRLDDLGYTQWSIVRGPGVTDDGCVVSALDTVQRHILLMMALRPEVRHALALAADQLLDRCLGKDEAAAFITSVLRKLGETDWELRSDGPIGGPIDRLDEVERHVDAGCFIYSGTGWTNEGRRLYYIGGSP